MGIDKAPELGTRVPGISGRALQRERREIWSVSLPLRGSRVAEISTHLIEGPPYRTWRFRACLGGAQRCCIPPRACLGAPKVAASNPKRIEVSKLSGYVYRQCWRGE